jgi:hypothetical protein
VRAAEALCIDAPLAATGRRLPPRAEVEAQLVAAVERALDDGVTPVVLAPARSGAGEVVALLGGAGLAVRVQARVAAWLDAYARAGITRAGAARSGAGGIGGFGPTVQRFRGSPARGEVVVWPLENRHATALGRLRQVRLLAAAGAALDPEWAARLRVDDAFALADHGDLPSLVAWARAAEARDVWLTRGLSEVVERAFAAAGVTVHPLWARRPMQQMALFAE